VFLPGVVALSSNNVWSVGEALQSGHLSRTLTEQWDGASWAMVQSPNLGTDHNELFAVDATPGGTLWAVGTVYHYPLQPANALKNMGLINAFRCVGSYLKEKVRPRGAGGRNGAGRPGRLPTHDVNIRCPGVSAGVDSSPRTPEREKAR
jgi:hypothetical protein